MASIKSQLDKGLKPLLQPIALKKLDGDPQFDYSVEDGRRRFTALTNLKLTEIELGQEAILIDGDSEINAYLANQHTNLSLAEEIKKLYSMRERFTTLESLAVEIGHSPTWVARRLNLLCCLACKIVLSCYIMASEWFSAIHGGLRLFRG